jgi:hypothetical protein
VSAEVVSDDVADVALEADVGHYAIEPHQGPDPVARERRNDGLVLARIAGCRRVRPLAAWRPGVRRGVAEVAAGFIKEDQLAGREGGNLGTPTLTHGRLLLARPQRLSSRFHPSWVSARLIVAVLTSKPETPRHHALCSASVASACPSQPLGQCRLQPDRPHRRRSRHAPTRQSLA